MADLVGHLPCGRQTAHPPHDVGESYPELADHVDLQSVAVYCPGRMSLNNPHNMWSDVLNYPYAIEKKMR